MSFRKACISIIVAVFLAVPVLAQSTIASGSTPLTNAGDNVDVKTGSTGSFRFFSSSNAQLLTITNDGRLGIGETLPAVKLHVVGDAHIVGGVGKGGVYTDTTSGINPVLTLKVNNVNGHYPRLRFADENNVEMGAVWGWKNTALLISAPTNRFIGLRAGGATTDQLIVMPDGRVGINTLTPGSTVKLDVNGNANFNGTVTGTRIQAHYQDVAEWVPSRTDLAPGTVVVLDAVLGNGVMPSSAAYDTTVAGVVSAEPGLILGVEGDSKEQVATTGRVKVKVDASRGPIAVGDLLVTSDKPGYAMRSTPIDVGGVQIHRPGTIVGKALEPFREGQGEILVLLSLQ